MVEMLLNFVTFCHDLAVKGGPLEGERLGEGAFYWIRRDSGCSA